jgi:hypothetical protein
METPTSDIEARLDALEQESKERRAELRAIAVSLPEATSRRALFRSLAADLRSQPDRTTIVKRVTLKVLRTPTDLARAFRRRLGS